MQKPAYRIRIGSATFDSSQNQEVISITVELDLDIPADCFSISIMPGTKADAIQNGDAVTIELGFDETLFKVLTGTVDSAERRISEVLVRGLSVVTLLTRTRVNQVFEQQTAGAIVKDLAKQAGLSVKKAEDGLTFPMYAIDDTKDAYLHMKELAKKCGFDLFLNPEGWVIFRKYSRQTPRPLRYGRDVIHATVSSPTPAVFGVKVCGESSSSFRGSDTAHWLTKKVVDGARGDTGTCMYLDDPSVKDRDSAEKVATAALESMMVPLSGSITSLGNARIALGDTLAIQNMPDTNMNGEFEVTSVTHTFSKEDGFVSVTGWKKKVSISAGEPPLAAPPPAPPMKKPPSPLEEQLESARGTLEEKRQQLVDAVETAEMNVEQSSIEINGVIAELDKVANEMIAAAEDLVKKAKEAAGKLLEKADELEQELLEKKKEIEEKAGEAAGKLGEYKKAAEDEIGKQADTLAEFKDKALKVRDEAKAKAGEATKAVEDRRSGATDEVDRVRSRADEFRKNIDEKQQQIASKKDELLNKAGEAKKRLEQEIDELTAKVDELRKKGEEAEKAIGDKVKEAEKLKEEAKEAVGKAEKEAEDMIAQAEAKVKEVQDKAGELKKEAEEAEKKIKEGAAETKKKVDDMIGEGEEKIEEIKKDADRIVKEAEEKLALAKKKVAETKKTAIEKFEKVKETYKETRDKVMEARDQLGI
jgi:predicted  nucleic acid-binding Zn-ribbon protein